MGLDEAVIAQTCHNIDPWFIDEETKKPKIRSNMVQEYFQSSLSVTKGGTVGKIHLLTGQDGAAVKEGCEYDMQLHLYGVRFLKTTFYLTWKLDKALERSCEEDENDEDEEVVAPLPSEEESIRDSLRAQVKVLENTLDQKKHATEVLYQRIRSVDIDNADISHFNSVHSVLQQIGSEI